MPRNANYRKAALLSMLTFVLTISLMSLVSALQKPAVKEDKVEGCLVGAYLGGGSEDLSFESIQGFNLKMGKPHAIFARYVDIKDSENPDIWAWAEEVKRNGAIPMFIYDPWDGLDAMDMGDVEYFGSKCQGFNETVFIVFGHEMNLHYLPWGKNPEDFKQKFREVAETFHREASNVEMCWVPNQNWGYPWGGVDYGDGYSEYYPEGAGVYGEYVNWVGLNFYDKDWDENNKVTPDFFTANIKNGQDHIDFYETFAVGRDKPMLISETAAFDPNKDPTDPGERDPLSDAEQAESKNEWLKQVYNVTMLKEEFSRLRAIVYFSVEKTELQIDTQNHSFYNIVADYRIPDSPNVYRNLISDPYFIGAPPVSHRVHNLCTNENFTAIQEAIDNPDTKDGHTILVEEGTYYENVLVSKSLSLVGENEVNTIIDGNWSGDAVEVTANNVTVTGFTLQRSQPFPPSSPRLHYGIYISSNGNNISHNIISANMFGVGIENSSNNILSENKITDNSNIGVKLSSSFNNTFSGNLVQGSTCNLFVWGSELSHFIHSISPSNFVDGKPIYYLVNQKDLLISPSMYPQVGYLALVNCSNIEAEGLTLTKNGQGLLLAGTNASTITGNNITDNYCGVWIYMSSNNIISENIITDNANCGVHCSHRSSNNVVLGNNITNNRSGTELYLSSNNSILGNSIANGTWGVSLSNSSDNSVVGNNIVDNELEGLSISYSSNNTITTNTIANNDYGVSISESNGKVYHNNIVNNRHQAWTFNARALWDDGYPSGGNFWNDYAGSDADGNGIGDTAHTVDANNTDRYPLRGMFSDFNATSEYDVQIICNSSISDFQSKDTSISAYAIRFNLTGEDGTAGFCRICIPTALMNATYRVFVNGTEVQSSLLPCSNSTHSYLYFTYSHSIKEIVIIPELASLIILPLLMIATLIAVIICTKKRLDIA